MSKTTATAYEIPSIDELNLDCMHQDELREFAMALDGIFDEEGRKPIRIAKQLFGKNYTAASIRVTTMLRDYAWHKYTAMKCRLKGDIASALVFEGLCDGIYKGLPEIAKW